MLKANSLLYAVYICLLVAIICGALLFYASLYNQLNLFYSLREELYIDNQSVVNYALGNDLVSESELFDEESGIASTIETKQYGLFKILVVNSILKSDTITSTHLVGNYQSDQTALYLSNFSKPLSFIGDVTLKGDLKLPSVFISEKYLNNVPNKLIKSGKIEKSERDLPKLNAAFKENFKETDHTKIKLSEMELLNDSIYYHSFAQAPIEIQLTNTTLENIIIKGNFVLHAKDSLVIKKSAILENVIIKAPKVTFEEEFKGSVQVFARLRIDVGKKAQLEYPSVLCLYNPSKEKSEIRIREQTQLSGAIVLFGNSQKLIDENKILIEKETELLGDVYCSGRLLLKGKVNGSIYTNALFYEAEASNFDNCIMHTAIDVFNKPEYFVSVPLFADKLSSYGIIKKVY